MMSDLAVQAWPAPRVGAGLAGMALACALACAVAGVAGSRMASRGPAAVAPVPVALAPAPAPPRWLAIIKPIQIFSLEAPQFRPQTLGYTARRLSSGEAREDTLAYGTVAGDAPMLRLAVLRGGTGQDSGLDAGLHSLAERQGHAATLGTRRGALTTRFGRFETATIRFPARSAACDGFHLTLATPALAIDGIACGTARADLACLIDRLDLASAGQDSALVGLFAAAELRRKSTCSGMRLAPDAVHPAWLDDKRVTPRKKMRRSPGI